MEQSSTGEQRGYKPVKEKTDPLYDGEHQQFQTQQFTILHPHRHRKATPYYRLSPTTLLFNRGRLAAQYFLRY